MKDVTRKMIVKYGCKDMRLDFMGYDTPNDNDFSFHHMIVPHRDCGKKHVEHDGYVEWNGAILNTNTGHPYLHTVEHYDRDMFEYLTKRLIEENMLGRLDLQTLRMIDYTLKSFEREYQGVSSKHSHKRIIKPEYTIRDYERKFR